MAHFLQNGVRISGKNIELVQNSSVEIGLWGPYANAIDELDVVSTSPNIVIVTRSGKPVKNNTRAWTLNGINPGGNAKVEARFGSDPAWDWIEVTVVTKVGQLFIDKLYAEGVDTARKYKLPVSIMIAQACLESNYGKSPFALGHNVLYGITKRKELSAGKEPDWYPQCKVIVRKPTIAKAGHPPVMDRFCGASTYQEAVEIWAQYVTQHPHSKNIQHLLTKSSLWTEQELRLIAGHMPKLNFGVGSENYGDEVMKIISDYGLRKYDQ